MDTIDNKEINLDIASSGTRGTILSIEGGWGIRQRLTQMGIHPGDMITVKQRMRFGGPILISANSFEIAVGRNMAKKIRIKVFETE